MRLVERWLIACILTAVVLTIAKLEANDTIQSDLMPYVNTSKDIVLLQKAMRQAFPNDKEQITVSTSTHAEKMLDFVNVTGLQDGYLLMYEKAPPIEAFEDGYIVFTGYTKQTGQTMTVYYNDTTVTYGLLDSFQHLPYTAVSKGEVLALKESNTPLFLKIEKDGQLLKIEEILALLREWHTQ